jgi:putative SOS response-associated peptidase YedK
MCGKFTAMASWSEVVDFSDALSASGGAESNDRPVTLKVMSQLPVIVFDREQGKRRVVPMRWGFPRRGNWRSPDPIHARAETIDTKPTFADAFRDGQRGIVIVKTFNEAPDLPGPTIQHTITPGDLPAVGIAFLWRRFEIAELPAPLIACVMATVPANALIAGLPTDRMPAILANEDWATWLGENGVSPEEAKACLKTVEGVKWSMTKEERAAKTPRAKPTVRDPGGRLF